MDWCEIEQIIRATIGHISRITISLSLSIGLSLSLRPVVDLNNNLMVLSGEWCDFISFTTVITYAHIFICDLFSLLFHVVFVVVCCCRLFVVGCSITRPPKALNIASYWWDIGFSFSFGLSFERNGDSNKITTKQSHKLLVYGLNTHTHTYMYIQVSIYRCKGSLSMSLFLYISLSLSLPVEKLNRVIASGHLFGF